MNGVYLCKILSNNLAYPPNVVQMDIYAPEIAKTAKPGEFVNVLVSKNYDPFLRRPFSIHNADAKTGMLSILYMLVGRGTELMKNMHENDYIDIVGPCGCGFNIDVNTKKHILISGGCGTAPMYFLSQALADKEIQILIGGKSKENLLCLDKFKNVLATTEDGSFGEKGFVTKLLEQSLANDNDAAIYACGPNPMLKAVSEIAAKYDINCQVSLENKMACGIGVCMGCVQKMKSGKYLRVCKDGPVFKAEDIEW